MEGAHTSFRSWTVLAALVSIGCAASVRADLAPASPFLPSNAAAAGPQAGPSGPIELRGVMETSDGVAYCIYDTAKKRTLWVGLNESGHDFTVRSADAASDSIRVDYQGRSLKLTLRAAKVASSGPVQGAAPAQVAPLSPVVLNPTPADEQRRLDAVSQEVRRRKMERERAALDTQNGPQQGLPPSPNR
jgi:hypothetical protein